MDIGALVNEQYQIIEHIGRGGMADVWSARDQRLRRMVAIKTIASGLGAEIDPVTLFKREAHTIAQMEHPHILPIYDFGEYDNSLYIVMRYVTGGSLEEMLRDGSLPTDEVLRIGEAIAQALDYAHDNKIIHLDLKPPNILLDSSQAPYLADFGLATALDPQGQARNPGSGTLLYMAPEQIISETIDYRADIYSFCVMLFHMLTGQLPFDGTNPLAMAQLQAGDTLPDLAQYVADIPQSLSDILRRGTSQNPDDRYDRHMEIMGQFREIVQPSGMVLNQSLNTADNAAYIEQDPYNMVTELYTAGITDAALLEAVDIYSRARYNWQGGQGRFLLGVTNFILMSEYYQRAAQYDLSIDEAGYQMLLRGALEYDHELDYWWSQLDDANRRWVCLHALRSGNTPARIRALFRLETLPDAEGTGVIPRLVAQALEIESDDKAKIAALTVLGTRAHLLKARPELGIKTRYQGRLISTMTRLGIQLNRPQAWREIVYNKDVDTLVAQHAFDPSPAVAEFAARTIGKMRSLTALGHIAQQQVAQRPGALEALAYVRDESPALPDVVHQDARIYAWLTNTVRRLTENPVTLVLRVALVFIGGWLAMGDYVWSSFSITVGTLTNARLSNTLGLGISFALLIALTYLVTVEVSRRLEGFWAWWMRLLGAGTLGFFMATITFASFRFLFMQDTITEIAWDEVRFIGAGLAFALLMKDLLKLSVWQSIILTILTVFTPIYAIHRAYFFSEESTIVNLALLSLLIGAFCGWQAADLFQHDNRSSSATTPSLIRRSLALAMGLAWAAGIWALYHYGVNQLIAGQSFTWDTVLLLSTSSLMFAWLVTYSLQGLNRLLFIVSAITGFVFLYTLTAWVFFDYQFSVPLNEPPLHITYFSGTTLLPQTTKPFFFYYDDSLDHIFRLALPFVIVIAIAVNFPDLLIQWWHWIGAERTRKERGAWLSSVLVFILVATALVSLLALFSPKINLIWEWAWSLWGAITFVCALATFRWAKWGARGLLYSGVLFIIGGIAYDLLSIFLDLQAAHQPALMQPMTTTVEQLAQMGISLPLTQWHFWAIWAIIITICLWGAQRRALWGGIGLALMLGLWFFTQITTTIQGSIAVLAVTVVGLLIYVLLDHYPLMEANRWRPLWQAAVPSQAPVNRITEAKPATPTAIIPPLATEVGQVTLMQDLNTVAFEPVPLDELQTIPAPALKQSELMTQALSNDDLSATVPAPQAEPSDLTDLVINLDTSAFNSPSTETVAAPAPQAEPSDLTDLVINLDTSALSQPATKDDDDDSDQE